MLAETRTTISSDKLICDHVASPAFSVIVPTYNRAESLSKVIESLFAQSFQDFEIIVVDDGSTDATESTVEKLQKKSAHALLYFKQQNNGAGAARNLGIKHANGELVLFIDDDVLPIPNLIEEHVSAHKRHSGINIAIVGPVFHAPELKLSPFMRWLDKGPAFVHSRAEDGAELDYLCFCTANISLKRHFMLENGVFDEKFRPFFEDIELGFRLKRQGLRIILNKRAVGYHLHVLSLRQYCERSVSAGRSAALFHYKWPAANLPRDHVNLTVRSRIFAIINRVMPPMLMPTLPVICWLDSHGCYVPTTVYAMIQDYYEQIGYKRGLKSIEKQ
jgi:glycosyltransferase involved in cell wall biosynthesis